MHRRIAAPRPASLLTVEQVANHLRIGTGAATRLITAGPLIGSYRNGELVVAQADLRRFTEAA